VNRASSKSSAFLQDKTWIQCGFYASLAAQLPYTRLVLTLALDTSSPTGSIALLREEKTIGVVSTFTEEVYSARMFRQLEFLLRELSLDLKEMDLFAVATGPGSFTGLRVGLAAVKGWAEVYGKPIAAVSALQAVAIQSDSAATMLLPALDARRGQVYFGYYGRIGALAPNDLVLQGDERVLALEEFVKALHCKPDLSDLAIVTPEPGLLLPAMSRYETDLPPAKHLRVHQVSAVLAPSIGRIGLQRAKRGELLDSLTLDANYVRRSDAELHLKAPAGS
jgi:tRNA threonylcarbamoyladenosine biosynthesis protein TsaB